jgi:hypothetical protein
MVMCILKSAIALLLVTGFNLCQASHLRKETTATKAVRSNPEKSLVHMRDLQDSYYTYRTNYTAQFQYLRDPLCKGPAPVIQVACFGPNSIQLLNTSDPSIVCSAPFLDGDGWSTIECSNTCFLESVCEDIYLNIGKSADGPFGEIRFQCEGNAWTNIIGAVTFLDSGNGTCAGNASAVDTRNFHVARMGVSCPTDAGVRAYDFDDFYFECAGPRLSIPGDGHPGDVYTCRTGKNCGGIECEVDFIPLMINTNVMNFMYKCVETSVPVAPTPAPVLNTTQSQMYTFSAKFEAAWSLLFDPVSGSTCHGNTPSPVQIICRNSDIKFVNSTYETVNCKTVSSGVMECTDNSMNSVDQFTGVVYVSEAVGLLDVHGCFSCETPGNV